MKPSQIKPEPKNKRFEAALNYLKSNEVDIFSITDAVYLNAIKIASGQSINQSKK